MAIQQIQNDSFCALAPIFARNYNKTATAASSSIHPQPRSTTPKSPRPHSDRDGNNINGEARLLQLEDRVEHGGGGVREYRKLRARAPPPSSALAFPSMTLVVVRFRRLHERRPRRFLSGWVCRIRTCPKFVQPLWPCLVRLWISKSSCEKSVVEKQLWKI